MPPVSPGNDGTRVDVEPDLASFREKRMNQTQKSRQATPDFPVQWSEPGDEQLNWVRDAMHYPYPLTPLTVGFTQRIFAERGFRQFRAWSNGVTTAAHVRTIYPQGFVYHIAAQPAEQDILTQEYRHHVVEMAPHLWEIWKGELEPEIRATCRQLTGGDYASMGVRQLAAHLGDCMDKAARAYGLTFVAASPMFASVRPLTDFCREEFGSDGGGIAAVLIQGFANESSGSDIGLWELAVKAASLPNVAQLFHERTAEELPAGLLVVEGGSLWLETFNQYIDRYGWRPDTWDELSMPTWKDGSIPALRIIQLYLAGGRDAGPRPALARSARRRRWMARWVASSLAALPEKLNRFYSALNMARRYVPVREGRAFWQLTLTGSLRIPCLALGEKLREMGVLDNPEDVFYLALEETQQIAHRLENATWREVVQHRRTEREFWMHAEPPSFVGTPPDAAPLVPSHNAVEEPGRGSLRGTPASVGVAQGRAKVVRTLEEADKVQQGDILVCRTTSPAWTFLFSRIAALVTDAGGVLSHCAIVAREYGIPGVVGARGATERIRDGMIITVDGGQGVVGIL
jgi:phosphohistidine swiveling domain-containing protein